MKTHFDLSVKYHGKDLSVKVQSLSNQLPQIKYLVWPHDSEMKHLSNVRQCYFKIESLIQNNTLEINHYVVYDYFDISNPVTDLDFEFSVWNSLLSLTNP